VRTLLLDRHIAITDFQHIHIIVREEVNRGQVVNVFANDRFNVLPGCADVDTASSQVRLESRGSYAL
jgi:hypothetical protein